MATDAAAMKSDSPGGKTAETSIGLTHRWQNSSAFSSSVGLLANAGAHSLAKVPSTRKGDVATEPSIARMPDTTG